jgi:hypothetical protein
MRVFVAHIVPGLGRSRPPKAVLRTIAAESAIFVLLDIVHISSLRYGRYGVAAVHSRRVHSRRNYPPMVKALRQVTFS